jgi:DNA invertase Pin-like site-specific DNA recombinase
MTVEEITMIVRFISYLRVSTEDQGRSGLGLEAQQATVVQHATTWRGEILAEYVEVETGRNDARPRLAEALAHCRRTGATLLIAKLDRLARSVHFVAGLMKSDVPFVAADMPHASAFELHIRASVAEEEARLISTRTKAALAAARARGVVLGGYRGAPPPSAAGVAARQQAARDHAGRLADIVRPMRAAGATLQAIADRLAADGVRAAGGGAWTATAVRRVLARI